jgi:ribosome recycling factor
MKATYKEAEERMQKTIGVLSNEFSSIRAGRANAAVLDRIAVDYYGVHTPINQMAAISVPEARTLVISPWDASSLKAIEKAIQVSDIGINPSNDGKSIRLMFPPLTEERRKDLAKEVHKFGEEAKVAIRSIRRDTIEKYKDMKKKSEITEDDLKDAEKDIQELTDKFVKEIDVMIAKKEKELLEV